MKMILTRGEYLLANEIIENVMENINIADIETTITTSSKDIQEEKRNTFFNHLNTLFLNVFLNRVDEFGEKGKEKAQKARKVCNSLMKSV